MVQITFTSGSHATPSQGPLLISVILSQMEVCRAYAI